jgi:hypothetical protein
MNNFIYVWVFISSICLSLVLALICHERLWSLQGSTATRREPTTRPRPWRRPSWSASHPRIWCAWSAFPFPMLNEARLREMQRQHEWYLMMMVHPFRDSRILKQNFFTKYMINHYTFGLHKHRLLRTITFLLPHRYRSMHWAMFV